MISCRNWNKSDSVNNISIIGPGLLGGSVALASKKFELADRISLWVRRPAAVEELMDANIAEIVSNDDFKILGVGEALNTGIKKGIVESITKAAESLEKAVEMAEKQANIEIEIGVTRVNL